MGDFDKHLKIMHEKLGSTYRAYENKEYTVVGDLAVKVVEQAIEADASREGKHLGDHKYRFECAQKVLSKDLFWKMRKIWFIYGDLGYDGVDGERAKQALKHLNDILDFFEKRWCVHIEKRGNI